MKSMDSENDCLDSLSEAELAEKLKDRSWRLNHLYKVVNEDGEVVRFVLRPIQSLFYRLMWFLNIILKSRQHGFTTFICIFILDQMLFNSNIRAGIIAHGLKEAQAIFQDKIKFPYDHLPEAIKRRRPAVKNDGNELRLDNNSSVRVGTSMRSGTLNFLLVTEYGKLCAKYPERAKEVRSGSLETVHQGNIAIIESTAEGNSGDFHDRCQTAQVLSATLDQTGGDLGPMDWKFFFFAWWQKPDNVTDPHYVTIPDFLVTYFNELQLQLGRKLTQPQRAWYTKKYFSLGPDLIKREHPSTPREAFEASIEGAYYGELIGRARDENRVCFVPHEKDLLVHTAWDLGISDAMSIIFFQVFGKEIRLIDYYEINNQSLESCIRYCQHEKPYIYGTHLAPHDIKVRDLTHGISRLEYARKLNFEFEVLPTDKISIQDGIDLVRALFHQFWFDNVKCEYLLKCLSAYRKEYNEKMERFEDRPLHDWSSHCASALKSLAVGYKTIAMSGTIHNEMVERNRQTVTADYDPLDY